MHVLVVEDHAKTAELIGRGLREQGFAVDLAATGRRGLELAQAGAFDAIVLDLSLPDIDGLEMLTQLRAGGGWAPVLVLTARNSVHDRVAGLDLGADDYLPKPFALDELLARIRALVRRAPAERPATLTLGDLWIDPASHDVRRGGVTVDLTPREFALLEYLARHAGVAVPRWRLAEHVWGYGFNGDYNVVEVYIRYLREKIDRPFGRRTIETVRGVGYRLRGE